MEVGSCLRSGKAVLGVGEVGEEKGRPFPPRSFVYNPRENFKIVKVLDSGAFLITKYKLAIRRSCDFLTQYWINYQHKLATVIGSTLRLPQAIFKQRQLILITHSASKALDKQGKLRQQCNSRL